MRPRWVLRQLREAAFRRDEREYARKVEDAMIWDSKGGRPTEEQRW
jgi:hypothetical protein